MFRSFFTVLALAGMAFSQANPTTHEHERARFDAHVFTIRGLVEDLRSGEILHDLQEKPMATLGRGFFVGAATVEGMMMLRYDLRLVANASEKLSLARRLFWLRKNYAIGMDQMLNIALGETEASALLIAEREALLRSQFERIVVIQERRTALEVARRGLIRERASAWGSAYFLRWAGFLALAADLTSASDNPEQALRDNPWLILNYGLDSQLEGFRRSLLLDEINGSLAVLENTLRIMAGGGALAKEIAGMTTELDARTEQHRQIEVPFVSIGSGNAGVAMGFVRANYIPMHHGAAVTDGVLRYRCISGPEKKDRLEHDETLTGSTVRSYTATPPTQDHPVGSADLESQVLTICGQRITLVLNLTADSEGTWLEARLMRSDGSFLNGRYDSVK